MASNGMTCGCGTQNVVTVAVHGGWQGADGQVQFRDDIYGLDTPQGIVTSTIQARKPKPKAIATPQPRPATVPVTAVGNPPAPAATASN